LGLPVHHFGLGVLSYVHRAVLHQLF
jgi:hypothetical protein